MAVPVRADFLASFPELVIHPEEVIDAALAAAGRVCAESVWGPLHVDGVGYYAAHLINARVREVGAITDQPLGNPTGSETMSSHYGQQYEALRRTLPVCAFFA